MSEENNPAEVKPAEPAPYTRKAEKSRSAKPASSPKSEGRSNGALWFLFLLILCVGGASAGMGYYGWMFMQQQKAPADRAGLENQVSALSDLPVRLESQLQALEQRLEAVDRVTPEQWQQNREAIEMLARQQQQVQALIQSLSTTTSSDWLLAEAEYLMRLANQRMMMEHSVEGALALLISADDILRQVEDRQLYGVRDQLQQDITQLKLAGNVDRSGRFLQLSALGDAVLGLPSVVRPLTPAAVVELPPSGAEAGEQGLWQKLRANFFAVMEKVSAQVRVRRHDQPVEPILPPDAESYLRQNVYFNVEQAQLALLREDAAIYRDSLERAVDLLQTHFYMQPQALVIAGELHALASAKVSVDLPDISGSLSAIRDFNATLHQLSGEQSSPRLVPASSAEGL